MLSGMQRYELPDPTLRAYDRGVGTLRLGGEVHGYLASVVGEIQGKRGRFRIHGHA